MSVSPSERAVSDSEVNKVFETLGLASQEQREKFLFRGPVAKLGQGSEATYESRVSSESGPGSEGE